MTEHATRSARKFLFSKRSREELRAQLYDLEADAIKALGHPKRLLILDLLSDGKERSVGELLDETSMAQSNLSQNLAVMRTAGLLSTRRDGLQVYCRIADTRVVQAVRLVRAVLTERVKDRQFMIEHAATKKRERTKRATTTGAIFALSIVVFMGLSAAFHPLLIGGSLADVGSHVDHMLASPTLGNLVETCTNVVT